MLKRRLQAAQAAYSEDIAAGRVKPGTGPVASTSTAAPKKPPPKPSNPFTNYSTAASLGFTDVDAERFAAETERRRTQGVAGEWEVVANIPPSTAPPADPEDATDEKPDIVGGVAGGGEPSLKREAEAPVDEEDTRQFKLRKKTWGGGLGDVYDPGAIPIKLKKKEQDASSMTPPSDTTSGPALASTSTSTGPTGVPKWTKVQWRRPGEEAPAPVVAPEEPAVKLEESLASALAPLETKVTSPAPPVEDIKPPIPKAEEDVPPLSTAEPPSAGGMFRKRKVPAGGSRGQR